MDGPVLPPNPPAVKNHEKARNAKSTCSDHWIAFTAINFSVERKEVGGAQMHKMNLDLQSQYKRPASEDFRKKASREDLFAKYASRIYVVIEDPDLFYTFVHY
jgi:hypothetical protein